MGAAVAVAADVLWTAVASAATTKIVTKVAKKIGMSDDLASVVGAVTGVAAGGAAWGGASKALGLGADTAKAASDATRLADAGASVADPSVAADVIGSAESTGSAAGGSAGVSAGGAPSGAGGGLLSRAGSAFKDIGAGAVSGAAQGYIQGSIQQDIADQRIREQKRLEEIENARIKAWQESAGNLPPRAMRNFQAPPLGPYPGQMGEFQGVTYPAGQGGQNPGQPLINMPSIVKPGLLSR